MSTKSLRLVLEEREKIKAKEKNDEIEECSETEESTGFKKNIFELLNGGSENEDDPTEDTPYKEEVSTKKKAKRKSKKKKNKEIVDNRKIEGNDEEDIDSIIKEVSEMATSCHGKVAEDNDCAFKSCFTVELRHLNPDNEIKKLFGNRVLLNEKKKKKERNVKKYQLITPRENVQGVLRKSGLSMDIVKRDGGVIEFVFVHSKSYQQAQRSFVEAIKSNHHENLIKVVEMYPFHVDALQQMSDLYRMQEDMQLAAKSIEHALYVFEGSFHPLFSLPAGTSRLDYRRKENRSFLLVLWRHVFFLSNKSLHRSAMEVAKLILSLSPDTDPLGILLILDHLCLRADQAFFLLRLYDEWQAPKNLFQLPNFAFSTPLASFLLSSPSASSSTVDASKHTEEMRKLEYLKKADEMLREALLMFPCFLLRLLQKCAVQPDSKVSSHQHFNKHFKDEPAALRMLIDLYIWRSSELWKGAEVLQWVERNVRVMVDAWSDYEGKAELYTKQRLARYKGTPRNIYRHIVISEARSAAPDIPIHLLSSIDGYDPLPPTDSVEAYDSAPRDNRSRPTDSNFLSLFVQSLSPAFNHNDPVAEDTESGRGWVGGFMGDRVEGARLMLQNRFAHFMRGEEDGGDDDGDDGGGDDGGDDDGGDDDVPRLQNWNEDEGVVVNDRGVGVGNGVRRRNVNIGDANDRDGNNGDGNDGDANDNNANNNGVED